jgi:hypothetical protein
MCDDGTALYIGLYPPRRNFIGIFIGGRYELHVCSERKRLPELRNGVSIPFALVNDSGNHPFQYQWNFGDGTANSTSATPQHAFENPGNYTVKLMIIDRDGDVDVYSAVIQVMLNEEPSDNDPFDFSNIPGLPYGIGGLIAFVVILVIYQMLKGDKGFKQTKVKNRKGSADKFEPKLGSDNSGENINWKL